MSVVMLSGWCVSGHAVRLICQWSCCHAGVSVVMLSCWCDSGHAGVSVVMLVWQWSCWCDSGHAVMLV